MSPGCDAAFDEDTPPLQKSVKAWDGKPSRKRPRLSVQFSRTDRDNPLKASPSFPPEAVTKSNGRDALLRVRDGRLNTDAEHRVPTDQAYTPNQATLGNCQNVNLA
jgi:hypothetical protein